MPQLRQTKILFSGKKIIKLLIDFYVFIFSRSSNKKRYPPSLLRTILVNC